MGCTLIKVTTHSSSKSLDFLYKYFMLKLPEFFGYEIKFQTIEDVARRGCHRSTLKMLLQYNEHWEWTIRKLLGGRESAKKFSRKGKLIEKIHARQVMLKSIHAIAPKKLYKLGKDVFGKKFMPFEIPHPSHNLSNGPSLSNVTFNKYK